ncbi:MAG: hypothetical protein ACFHU9_01345 [Fluviicola sp.]
MNFILHGGLNLERIALFIFLLALFTLSGITTRFYFRLRNRSVIIEFENQILNDYSKPMNRASGLRLNDIKSIVHWNNFRGVNQYKLITKNENEKDSAITNQLKNKHYYLTDYIVSTEELLELVKVIEARCV